MIKLLNFMLTCLNGLIRQQIFADAAVKAHKIILEKQLKLIDAANLNVKTGVFWMSIAELEDEHNRRK